MQKRLVCSDFLYTFASAIRDLAQLVAHTSGGREVAGSSPVIPTLMKSVDIQSFTTWISTLFFFITHNLCSERREDNAQFCTFLHCSDLQKLATAIVLAPLHFTDVKIGEADCKSQRNNLYVQHQYYSYGINIRLHPTEKELKNFFIGESNKERCMK